jgi:hypothetical protein
MSSGTSWIRPHEHGLQRPSTNPSARMVLCQLLNLRGPVTDVQLFVDAADEIKRLRNMQEEPVVHPENATSVLVPNSEAGKTPKRRGRPKGSKNRPKI